MTELTIAIPPVLDDHVRERVASGAFADPADYVRDLIRADQRALAELRATVADGLASGVSELSFADIVAEAQATLPRG